MADITFTVTNAVGAGIATALGWDGTGGADAAVAVIKQVTKQSWRAQVRHHEADASEQAFQDGFAEPEVT